MEELVKALKAISDPGRIRILKMLEQKPLCVCEITEILGLAVSTVSSHLSILREAGFITDSKAGRWVEYRINRDSENIAVVQLLALLRGWLAEDEHIVFDKEKITKTNREMLCSQ